MKFFFSFDLQSNIKKDADVSQYVNSDVSEMERLNVIAMEMEANGISVENCQFLRGKISVGKFQNFVHQFLKNYFSEIFFELFLDIVA